MPIGSNTAIFGNDLRDVSYIMCLPPKVDFEDSRQHCSAAAETYRSAGQTFQMRAESQIVSFDMIRAAICTLVYLASRLLEDRL